MIRRIFICDLCGFEREMLYYKSGGGGYFPNDIHAYFLTKEEKRDVGAEKDYWKETMDHCHLCQKKMDNFKNSLRVGK